MNTRRTRIETGFWALAFAALLAVVAFSLARCGGDDDPIDIIEPPTTPSPSPSATVVAEPTPDPTEFRVAYINLMSPKALDATNTIPSDTFDERIALVVAQLKEFKPDVVAFSEATETAEHGKAAEILVRELKLEQLYIRAKPWVPGQSKEQQESLVKLLGWEEGELILYNGKRFPHLDGERHWLNPRTGDFESPAALWMRFKGPDSIGEIDVFVTHLTGTDTKVRAQQAASLLSFVDEKKGSGPVILLGDLGDAPDSPTVQVFTAAGLVDTFTGIPETTCCRESVIGEQPAPATRTSYLLASRWKPSVVDVFGDTPGKRQDGTLLYASDHNGLTAVFPIP
jgi:endonuclease/exonuclease/phosphatase family metal-dependent hydrolase